jgi:PilZ domain
MRMVAPDSGDGAQIRLLLVVEDHSARECYCRELSPCGAEVVVVADIFPVDDEVAEQRFHGLLFDIRSKMKAIRRNKAEVYRLTARFPTAHLQHDGLRGTVRVFHPGQGAENDLTDFVSTHCRRRQPQKLRSSPRKLAYLPVLLWIDDAQQRSRRLVTRDISPGGCFLVSYQRYRLGKRLRLEFTAEHKLGTLAAEVASVVIWGTGRELPGIGVEFTELTPEQAATLQQLCATL